MYRGNTAYGTPEYQRALADASVTEPPYCMLGDAINQFDVRPRPRPSYGAYRVDSESQTGYRAQGRDPGFYPRHETRRR